MAQIPEKPQRRSIRLEEYDYSQPGAYFITLVAHQRQALFGKIENGSVTLNQLGNLAVAVWHGLETRFSAVQLDDFVIMPDHLHGIIFINEERVGARREATAMSVMSSVASPAPVERHRISLGDVVGAYKSTVTRLFNRLGNTPGRNIWQRNYYEHVIRDDLDLDQVRCYIQENPSRWEEENADRYPWEK